MRYYMFIAVILLAGCDLMEEKEPLGCAGWRAERIQLHNRLAVYRQVNGFPSDSTTARFEKEINIIVEKMENAGCDDY